jgi:hypothetical protein
LPVFLTEDLNSLQPPHLKPLDQETVVVSLAFITFGKRMPSAVSVELRDFVDDPTRHMARRLANAVQGVGAIGLAAAIDAALLKEAKP